MKGVILSIAPDARLVDLCHEIPPQDLVAATLQLELNRVASVRQDAAALRALEDRFTALRTQARNLERAP